MRVLSYSDLISEKGIRFSKVWLWRLERDGKFPKRVKLGEKRYGWLADEIESWLKARSASRDETPQAA
jgi:prophage regulatory protein